MISTTSPSASGKPSVRTSDIILPIWRGGKVHDRRDLAADQRIGPVVHGDLRRAFLDADLRAEIDLQPHRGFARAGQRFGRHDGADADIDFQKIVEGNARR